MNTIFKNKWVACSATFWHAAVIIVIVSFTYDTIHAQNIILSDTTINDDVTFATDNAIIAGPNITITASGNVGLRSGNGIYFLTEVTIVEGGQLYASTGLPLFLEADDDITPPEEFTVSYNYPNPFNPTTKIQYKVPATGHVRADIYNVYGEKVVTLFSAEQSRGSYDLTWDGTNSSGQKVSSGIYYLQISTGKHHAIRKMTLLK